MDKQNKIDDENICLQLENEKQHDIFAVAMLVERRVMHVPRNLRKYLISL